MSHDLYLCGNGSGPMSFLNSSTASRSRGFLPATRYQRGTQSQATVFETENSSSSSFSSWRSVIGITFPFLRLMFRHPSWLSAMSPELPHADRRAAHLYGGQTTLAPTAVNGGSDLLAGRSAKQVPVLYLENVIQNFLGVVPQKPVANWMLAPK